MQTLTVTRTIAAPIEDVFDWLVNCENYRGVPGVLRSEVAVPGDPPSSGVGAERVVVTPGMRLRERVTGNERPHRFTYRLLETTPKMRHEHGEMRFHEVPGGTEVVWSTTLEAVAPFGEHLATRVLLATVRVGFSGVLRACARKLERSAA